MSDFAVEAPPPFPLGEVCSVLRARGFKRVVLQFPDEHVKHSVAVYDFMLDALNPVSSASAAAVGEEESAWVDVFIAADSTYGSSVDDISADHVSADVLVYFGSDLSSSGAMPVLVVPAVQLVDSVHCADCLLQELQPVLKLAEQDADAGNAWPVLVLYEPGCARGAADVFHRLSAALAATSAAAEGGSRIALSLALLPPCADIGAWSAAPDGKIGATSDKKAVLDKPPVFLGGLHVPPSLLADARCHVLYIGDKEDQLTSVRLQLGVHHITSYSPASREAYTARGEDCRAFRERYGGVSRVKAAAIVGLVIGSMGLTAADTRELMERLQALCVAAGKKTYTFVMGRLNEAKLCNFPEVDIFCFISNEDVSLIPPKTFHAPVLTPWELEIGLGAREWSSSYMARPTAVLDGELSAAVRKVRDARSDDEDDSGVDDDAEESGLQAVRGNAQSTALTTTEAQREGRLVEFSSPAGDFLKARDYQGMAADVPEGHSLEVHKGKVGLAASYADIR